MMSTHTGNTSSLSDDGQDYEVGSRKGAEEVVVKWADSVVLVWFV
jgi:hypothetical protein